MYVWKTVKIFISSTFKDLEMEGDKLAKIFRYLQQKFYDRKIAIVLYDLRWRQKHEKDLPRLSRKNKFWNFVTC